MVTNNPWSDPNVPSQGFSLPVALGPMTLPAKPPRRRWGWIVGLMLLVFAGGVAAGPFLVEYASEGVEAGAAFLAKRAPRLLGKYRPPPPMITPETARLSAVPAPPAPRAPVVAPVVVAQPSAPAQTAAAPSRPGARASARADVASAQPTAARAVHAKGAARPAVAAAATSKRPGKGRDPFALDAEAGREPASARKAKAADEPAKSEPTPKPAAARSSDSLDSLIADAVTETKGKSKKRDSKDIDAMLKDVQKSEPAPAAKPKAQADLPPLSPSDISRAMSMVKTRGNACAQRLGQSGNAELQITVGKDGRVTDARVGGKVADSPLGACIEKAARAAKFPPNAGLRFDYRIDVR